MVRVALHRRGRLRTSERAARAARKRVRRAYWIDPFPGIHGTLPEKMVYAELSRRRIPFLFLNDLRFQFPEIDFDKTYQADFCIPHLRLIIEVNGSRWHSMAATIEADAFKYAVYETAGYTILPWWDYDIEGNLFALFAAVPALGGQPPLDGLVSTELTPIARTKVDTSKGIRTLNRKLAARKAYKKKAVRRR